MTKLLPHTISYSLQALENDGTNCDAALTNGMCCEPAWLEPHCSTFTNVGFCWHPFNPGRSTFLFGLRGTAKYDACLRDELCAIHWTCGGSTFQLKDHEKLTKSAFLRLWQVVCKIQIPQAFIKACWKNGCRNTSLI